MRYCRGGFPELSVIGARDFTDAVSLAVTYDGKQFQVAPKWGISTLPETLEWLLWADRLGFCAECEKLFEVTSYRWKYCTDECAKRATDRKWRQEYRSKLKKGPAKKGRRK